MFLHELASQLEAQFFPLVVGDLSPRPLSPGHSMAVDIFDAFSIEAFADVFSEGID